jgi:acyl dehydratase
MSRASFASIEEGETSAPVTMVESVGRMDWVAYAGASGDFNPMHTDEAAARAAGLPSPFGHGMFTAGVLATALTNRFGIGSLRRYKVRFVRQVWPGEAMVVSYTVQKKYQRDGENLVDLECRVVNQSGELTISGEATARVE